MKKHLKISLIVVFLCLTVLPVLVVGSKFIYVRDTQVIPLNFQEFPDGFDEGRLPWDLDIIDKEKVASEWTGEGVYVAILDTGLVSHWKHFFPEERIKEEWGRGFVDRGVMREEKTGVFISDVHESKNFIGDHPHGTHVTSTVIGYSYYGIDVQGVAPYATIIPVKVLETYPGLPGKPTFGTSEAVAAGIDYVTGLADENPGSRFIISMSLGAAGEDITDVERIAIDAAIAAGVIVVTSAGNEGPEGMGSPGNYAPVISVGSSGWASWTFRWGGNGEWIKTIDDELWFWRAWWYEDVPEDNAYVSYISNFSSRERPDLFPQELDIVAPGSWVVGPYPLGNLPWWSNGNGYGNLRTYYYVGGTSMACPHVSGVVALMLQVNPTLQQGAVETILKSTADPLPFAGGQVVFNPFTGAFDLIEWGYDGYDAVGSGLLQADAAVAAA